MQFNLSADSKRKLESHPIKRIVFECVRMHEESGASVELDVTRDESRRLRELADAARLRVDDYLKVAVAEHLDDALTSLANDVDAFIADYCVRSPDSVTPFAALWQAYRSQGGSLIEKEFAAALTKLRFNSERRYIDGATKAVRVGIALTDS